MLEGNEDCFSIAADVKIEVHELSALIASECDVGVVPARNPLRIDTMFDLRTGQRHSVVRVQDLRRFADNEHEPCIRKGVRQDTIEIDRFVFLCEEDFGIPAKVVDLLNESAVKKPV